MTPISPTALEEAAKAMHSTEPWSSFWSTDDARLLATAAITAYLAQREKEGFVEVPKEATQAMLDAATSTTSGYGGPDHDYDDDVRDHYRAMLAQNGGEG